MKKILLNSFIIALFFGTSATAEAQTATSSRVNASTSTERARAIQNSGESAEETRNNLQARIENRYDKMIERFQRAINRETQIMVKINSRISKIKALGGNTSEAEGLTVNAKIELDKATTTLATLESLVETAMLQENSGKPNESLATMRTTARDIEKSLREAHRNLLKSVGVLRGVSQLSNASTTSSTEINNN